MTARPRVVLAAAAIGLCGAALAPAQAAIPTSTYVVTLAHGQSAAPILASAKLLGGHVRFVYSHALNGFSVTLPVPALPSLQRLPGIAAVQPNHVLRIDTTQANPPSYGIDRIDQRSLPLNSTYRYRATGAGVTAYVLDTGINYSHVDFGGRARPGYDAITAGGGAVDCNGHGSHVSGTIGGTTYGVAKKVALVGVRVLDCDGQGSTEQIVAGLDWVAAHAVAPAVANMSMEGGADSAIDTAVKGVIAKGVTVAVAAGNDGGFLDDLLGLSNACSYSPARVTSALTVAAVDSTDTRAGYSNIGSCVDVWAPGTGITSAWTGSRTAHNTIDGTSMATPHVTGTAALYLASHRTATPAQVASAISSVATQGAVQSPGSGTPNRLLFEAW